MNPDEDIADLLITIGPPCAGKTTYLSTRCDVDVCIDDGPNVYKAVAFEEALAEFVTDGQLDLDMLKSNERWEQFSMVLLFKGWVKL